MRVSDVLRNKGAGVDTVNPGTQVSELLRRMADHNIGAMVVTGPDGIVGIVSERDVVRNLTTHGANLLAMPVSAIMTTSIASCVLDDSVDKLFGVMTERRIRHIPVIVDRELVGIVSIGDVVKMRMEELKNSQDQLQAYISQG
ncbi:CBS domain-containing protein [Antrihabitans cavernicola]|uniref:CBS domain-containing protein n=1 Tax=Antrihabitans cavernicola TaxID=2495913 RepID=A0A5A7SFZ1_9NOCA|nr:CBS domain-containing protein [Spelaeibacter cavernicola]KAA0024359.1 CBS domain-containing protein [Spelaeibacter cavernicola]